MSDTKPRRLQVILSPKTQETLERLRAETNLGSDAQVLRVALHVLEELHREQRAGTGLLLVREGEAPQKLKLIF